MVGLRWCSLLCVLALAGCLEPSVDRPPGSDRSWTASPTIAFSKDEAEDSLIVTAVESGFRWDSLGVKGEPEGTMGSAGGAEGAPAIRLVPTEFRSPSSSMEGIEAGDFLQFCAIEGTVGPATYSVAHLATNTLVYVGTFQDVAACAGQ